jgi:hypothetical protein
MASSFVPVEAGDTLNNGNRSAIVGISANQFSAKSVLMLEIIYKLTMFA